MNYRRVFIQNSYLHIIILAYQRRKIFIDKIELLRQAFNNAKKYFQFNVIAICVLPNHIHFILNSQDINEYPKIITSIKYYFSRNYYVGVETPTYENVETPKCKLGFQPNNNENAETPKCKLDFKPNNNENAETPKCKLGFQPNNITKPTYGYINKGEKGIFQRRYYEHTITSQEELNNHIDYIHYNPVKHGYVEAVRDWEYSSFHKFVKDGFYAENWCDFDQVKDMNYE